MTTPAERYAFNEGRQMYFWGGSELYNPYDDLKQQKAWLDGFDDAREEDDERRGAP